MALVWCSKFNCAIIFAYVLATIFGQSPTQGPTQSPSSGCLPGYGGELCSECPIGTYSTGDGICSSCNNAPSHSYYTTSGWETASCPYECFVGYSGPLCASQLQTVTNYFGGGVASCVLLGIVVLLSILPRKLMKYGEEKQWWVTNPKDCAVEVEAKSALQT